MTFSSEGESRRNDCRSDCGRARLRPAGAISGACAWELGLKLGREAQYFGVDVNEVAQPAPTPGPAALDDYNATESVVT